MNPNKVDLQTERSAQQWSILLDTVKRNDDNILTKVEQQFYVNEISYKLGIKNKNIEILKDIQDGMPDYSDIF